MRINILMFSAAQQHHEKKTQMAMNTNEQKKNSRHRSEKVETTEKASGAKSKKVFGEGKMLPPHHRPYRGAQHTMFPTAFNHKNTMHCLYDIHSSFHATLYSSHNNFPSNDFSFPLPLPPPPPPPQFSGRKERKNHPPPPHRRHNNGIFILFHILCIFLPIPLYAVIWRQIVVVMVVLTAFLIYGRRKSFSCMKIIRKEHFCVCNSSTYHTKRGNRKMLIFH